MHTHTLGCMYAEDETTTSLPSWLHLFFPHLVMWCAPAIYWQGFRLQHEWLYQVPGWPWVLIPDELNSIKGFYCHFIFMVLIASSCTQINISCGQTSPWLPLHLPNFSFFYFFLCVNWLPPPLIVSRNTVVWDKCVLWLGYHSHCQRAHLFGQTAFEPTG